MKRTILTIVSIGVAVIGAFIGGAWVTSRQSEQLLADYNGMASGNFSVALASFRDDYKSQRIQIFGEVEDGSTFRIDDFQFVVIPTVADRSNDSFNPEHCNMAAHFNSMVVMLACTWITNSDPRGEELLSKLQELIPSFKLSAPDMENVVITNLKNGSSMMRSEADQWDWRMADLGKKNPNKAEMATPRKPSD